VGIFAPRVSPPGRGRVRWIGGGGGAKQAVDVGRGLVVGYLGNFLIRRVVEEYH